MISSGQQRRLHATVLLCILAASGEISKGLPLSSSILLNELLYNEAISSDEGPVYRTNEFDGLSDNLAETPQFRSKISSTVNKNLHVGGRKSPIFFRNPGINGWEQNERNRNSRIAFPFQKTDAEFSTYSSTLDGNSVARPWKDSKWDQLNQMTDSLLVHPPTDESDQNDDRSDMGMRRLLFRLNSSPSKRDRMVANRNEGKLVHPVFLGFGQQMTGAALSTLARLLQDDEERLHLMNPSGDGTKESIRFIG